MRVISGAAKKTILKAPADKSVRPTSDRVKESLFNILGGRVPESEFLDLFAGSGALGIEALSRGGERCVFIEKDPGVINILKANLSKTKLAGKSSVLKGDVNRVLPFLAGKGASFDIIFMDPPYAGDFEGEVLKLISELDILSHGGVVVVESHKKKLLPENVYSLHRYRLERYGDTMLTFYRSGHEEGENSCE